MSEPFIPPSPLQTAVLFLVFNRPDPTRQVFEAIRSAKPPRLYVAADGPRADRKGETERVDQVRKIATAVDWPCEVKILFRQENLGCKKAVSEGIDWFFQYEQSGIILEDDCLPVQSFFWFCEKMLNLYSSDSRIFMISGTNYLLDIRKEVCAEFIFSRHFSIWGWATWRRAWKSYEVNIEKYESKDHEYIVLNRLDKKFYEDMIKVSIIGDVDTWDYQWVLNCCFNYGLSVTPSVNLISNIGIEGAHANEKSINNFLPTKELDLTKIVSPKRIMPNNFHDVKVSIRNRSKKSLTERFFNKLNNKFFK